MSPYNAQIDEIVSLEWAMFQTVNEGGLRASCQDDPATFRGMRAGQFRAWSDEAVAAYLEDLHGAKASGRNLVKEKYLYMMAEANPEILDKLSTYIKIPEQEVFELVDAVIKLIVAQTFVLYRCYPLVTRAGRPLYAHKDEWAPTSVAVYQRCELLTYSATTLDALNRHIWRLADTDESYVERVLTHTVQYYGYPNLEVAEKTLEGSAGTHLNKADALPGPGLREV